MNVGLKFRLILPCSKLAFRKFALDFRSFGKLKLPHHIWFSSGLGRMRKFQLYEVKEPTCHNVRVTVIQAHNIAKKSLQKDSLIDQAAKLISEEEPDPYIILNIADIANGRRQTQTMNNQSDPFWNETFEFYVDANKNNILEITLMDADYVGDDKLAFQTYDLSLIPLNQEITTTMRFNESTQVEFKFHRTVDESSPSLRLSADLCEEENEFVRRRKEHVYKALRKLLGEEKGPKNLDEVPTIAVLGSGGGFRAMVGLCGAFKALHNSGILDCATYIAGTSGSTWYISTLYSHPGFPRTTTPNEIGDELKLSIDQSPFGLLRPQQVYKYVEEILEKKKAGQLISFTDLFGIMLRDTLLKTRPVTKLSHQRSVLEEGDVPLPLYASLHVRKNVQARVYHEWVEFSPFEIGFAKYGTYMKPEHFGSMFYLGRLRQQFSEYPLHYLLGIWGSAFAVLFRQLLWMNETDKLNTLLLDSNTAKKEEVLQKQVDEFTINDDDEDEEKTSRQDTDSVDQEEPNNVSSKVRQMFHSAVDAMHSSEILNNIVGRAASVYNPMRGLEVTPIFNEMDNESTTSKDEENFKGLHEAISTTAQSLYMVDGGLAFNSPYPLLLRPQRNVQLFLSFDFSSRLKDQSPPFKDLLLAADWAQKVGIPFPPVQEIIQKKYSSGPVQEYYVFQHPSDPNCPTVMHFVLINHKFKDFKVPGVARQSPEDKKMANFSIFEDFENPFSIFNFKYSHEKFDQLSQLMEFNTLLGVDSIKENISELITPKQSMTHAAPANAQERPASSGLLSGLFNFLWNPTCKVTPKNNKVGITKS